SMIKRVDLAIYQTFTTAKDGTWKPGVRSLGVAEGGVGYAIDQYNRSLITPEMEKRLEQARADIVAGKIKVTDYMAQKGRLRRRRRSSCGGSTNGSARFTPTATYHSPCARARSTASSARTAPASPP